MAISLITPSAGIPALSGLGQLAGDIGSDSPASGSFGGLIAQIMGKPPLTAASAALVAGEAALQGGQPLSLENMDMADIQHFLHPLAAGSGRPPPGSGNASALPTTSTAPGQTPMAAGLILGSLGAGSANAAKPGSGADAALMLDQDDSELPGKDRADTLTPDELLALAGLPLSPQPAQIKTGVAAAGELSASAGRHALSASQELPGGIPGDMAAGLQQQAQNSANPAAQPGNHAEGFQHLLNQAGTAGSSSSLQQPASAAARDGLQSPVHSEAWAQEFGEKVVWMARSDQQQAQLSLNPAHLGPLQISLNLEGEQATASFVATTPEVRQAIEDALPRLREMLAGAGISLGQTQVGTQAQQEQAQAWQAPARARSGGDAAILEADTSKLPATPLRRGAGLVDLFA